MSTIVKAELPVDQFALAETFERVPDATFDAVRFVTNGIEENLPLMWGTNEGSVALSRVLESDPTTDSVQMLSRRNSESLYRVRWSPQVRSITDCFVAEGGALVSAFGRTDGWTFRLLFPERDAVSRTYDRCREADVDLDILQMHDLAESPPYRGLQLTDEQFATVKTAVENGYYQVPRETTLQELSDELDVSHQALSERLRRGHRTLIGDILGPRIEAEPSD